MMGISQVLEKYYRDFFHYKKAFCYSQMRINYTNKKNVEIEIANRTAV